MKGGSHPLSPIGASAQSGNMHWVTPVRPTMCFTSEESRSHKGPTGALGKALFDQKQIT